MTHVGERVIGITSETVSQPSAAEHQRRELALLFDIARDLACRSELRQVVGQVLRRLAEQMGFVRTTLTVLDRELGELGIEQAYGMTPEAQARGRYRVGEGVTGRVVATGQPIVVPRVSQEPRYLDRTGTRRRDLEPGEQDICFICVPISVDGRTVGTLSADRLVTQGGDHDHDHDLRVVYIVASLIAGVAARQQSHREQMRALEDENLKLQQQLGERVCPTNMIGRSHAMRRVMGMIQQVAATPTSVLILGESGVGKELVADAIHQASTRAAGPLIKVNCAALPESIVESELFGHERGAFTGAMTTRKGRFEAAQGGTIFLDEIGDLPPSTQVKLLRVLQARQVERLGSNTTIDLDVRIVAGTNRDLEQLVAAGRFREDLYYRLSVFPLHVPPLRARKTDIMLLADHFVEKFARVAAKQVCRISSPAIDMLMSYHWPGNVRELENCIERAVILSSDGSIHSHHLPPSLQTPEQADVAPQGKLQAALDAVERDMILDALKATRGNMARAAELLGLTERVMGLRVHKYVRDVRRFRRERLPGPTSG